MVQNKTGQGMGHKYTTHWTNYLLTIYQGVNITYFSQLRGSIWKLHNCCNTAVKENPKTVVRDRFIAPKSKCLLRMFSFFGLLTIFLWRSSQSDCFMFLLNLKHIWSSWHLSLLRTLFFWTKFWIFLWSLGL